MRVLAAAGLVGRRFNGEALYELLDENGDGFIERGELFLGLFHLVADDAPLHVLCREAGSAPIMAGRCQRGIQSATLSSDSAVD